MITSYFKWRQSQTRLLATPAGPHLSALAEELAIKGFSYWILRARLQGAAHFSDWNKRQGRSIEQLQEDMFEEFGGHLGKCRCRRPLRLSAHDDMRALAGARALVEYLRRRGVITSPLPSKKEDDPPILFSGFCDWMRCQRGMRPFTPRAGAFRIMVSINASRISARNPRQPGSLSGRAQVRPPVLPNMPNSPAS